MEADIAIYLWAAYGLTGAILLALAAATFFRRRKLKRFEQDSET